LDAEAEIIQVDYTNPISLARALRGVDRVYMAAPLAREMVDLTRQVVVAAVRAGVRHFVKLSVLNADQCDDLQLAHWHRTAERMVEDSGMAWTHLRPNSFMQNFTNQHLGSMKAQGLFHHPVGEARVSYIDIEDIAAVAVAVLTRGGYENRALTLTGPEVSVEASRDAMFGFGLPEPVVDAVAELYQAMRAGRFDTVTPTVETVLGRPARSFAQFAAEQAALFR
jgi:uncharacterized protein YbjT (DUF2867 family)